SGIAGVVHGAERDAESCGAFQQSAARNLGSDRGVIGDGELLHHWMSSRRSPALGLGQLIRRRTRGRRELALCGWRRSGAVRHGTPEIVELPRDRIEPKLGEEGRRGYVPSFVVCGDVACAFAGYWHVDVGLEFALFIGAQIRDCDPANVDRDIGLRLET